MRMRVVLDGGGAIVLDHVDPEIEVMGDYVNAFAAEAATAGHAMTFQQGPEDWLVVPVARVLAVQAAPDLPTDPEEVTP